MNKRILEIFTESKKPKIDMAGLKKKYVDELWDGTKIYEIDGQFLRSNIDVDFVWGGNGYAYDYIPKNEIWYEPTPDKDEYKYILVHEITEYIFMKYKNEQYPDAHNKANSIEAVVRHAGMEPGTFKRDDFILHKKHKGSERT